MWLNLTCAYVSKGRSWLRDEKIEGEVWRGCEGEGLVGGEEFGECGEIEGGGLVEGEVFGGEWED